MSFNVRLWHNIAETNCSVHRGMGHIILDGTVLNVVVIFLFLPCGLTFHSLPQDGRHPEKSHVNNDLQAN